ncbi:hypothetical protein DFH09DRAFT_1328166 [Mycena vulgaris]|nr:hypothetical protein DFH09DRAFT_1328166 [Mycena vulgaris]
MSSLSEPAFSLLASPSAPSSTTGKVFLVALVLTLAACTVYYASPMRLTRILVAAIADVEKTYLEAVETGVLSKYDVHMGGTLTRCFKVSHIRETSLRNSLSHRAAFCEFIKGRTLTLLQCIGEVRGVETHIEILKEEQLRDLYPHIGAAIESGVLPKSDSASTIREASLRNSLSYGTTVSEFQNGCTLILLLCIRDVQRLQTHIEIFKEAQRLSSTTMTTPKLRRERFLSDAGIQ